MKKIIITGVTGQDGSYMADHLLTITNYEIYGMARRTSKPDLSNLKEAIKNPRFKLVTGDLSDGNSLETLIREILPDYFINFGAQSFVASSWQIPEQTFDTVALGPLRILESIRKHRPTCRFYSAGSSEEMGDVLYSPQDLNHPIRPRSPYGCAKASARHITKCYRESYGLYAIHSILYNHESERRGEEFVTRKITKGVARIKKAMTTKKEFAPIELGNLDSERDWSHAKDFVKGVWMMMNQEQFNSELKSKFEEEKHLDETAWLSKNVKEYILSSNETHSIREFVEKAFAKAGIDGAWHGNGQSEEYSVTNSMMELLDLKSSVLVKINPKFFRPAEVDSLLGNSNPVRTELGWTPEISFDKLVELMVLSDLDEEKKSQ